MNQHDPMRKCRLPGAPADTPLERYHAVGLGVTIAMFQMSDPQISQGPRVENKKITSLLWELASANTAAALMSIETDTPGDQTNAALELAQTLFLSDDALDDTVPQMVSVRNQLQKEYSTVLEKYPKALELNPSLRHWKPWEVMTSQESRKE